MYIQNKYHHTYFKIINRSRNRVLSESIKTEIHHILPRSLGGTNDPENLATLTLKEHWVCHRLLVKFLIDKKHLRKMYNALFMMAVKDYRTVNGRIYQQIKENIEPWNKGMTGLYQPPMTDENKKKLRDLWKGKARPKAHKDAMRAGWERIKQSGYQPWNKGITGLRGPCKPIILVSPTGEEFLYESLKAGCKDKSLIYTKMSSVNSGKLSNYKGWTLKPVNTV